MRDKAEHRWLCPATAYPFCLKCGFAKSSSLNPLDFNRLQQFLQIGLTFRKRARNWRNLHPAHISAGHICGDRLTGLFKFAVLIDQG